MDRNKVLEFAREAGLANRYGAIPPLHAFERFAALIEAEVRGDAEPDWRHPKIQALIAAEARKSIVIWLIERLIENPEYETTASDMEYWSSIHDALLDKLTHPAPVVDAEPVAWYTEDHLTDKSATTWSKDAANKWRSKGWPVFSLYTRPAPAVVRQLVEAVAAAKLDIHSARLCEVNSMSSRGEVRRLMGSACEKLGAALAAAEIGKQMGGSDD